MNDVNCNCEINPNENQKKLLDKFMNLHKDLSDGTIENTQMAETLWGQLTQFLNIVGPPYPLCSEWKTYWNYVKSQAKIDIASTSSNSKVLNNKQTVPIQPKIINNGQSSGQKISKDITKIDSSKVIKNNNSQPPINTNKKLINSPKSVAKIYVKKKIKIPTNKQSKNCYKFPKKFQNSNYKKSQISKRKIARNQTIKKSNIKRKTNNKSLDIEAKRKNISTTIKKRKLRTRKTVRFSGSAVKKRGRNLRKKH